MRGLSARSLPPTHALLVFTYVPVPLTLFAFVCVRVWCVRVCVGAQGYVRMRQQGLRGGKKVITATPRQLESLIRLSEAHARAHLRSVVSSEDVKEAIRLIKVATQQAATDPKTGTIDMNLITTGVPTQGAFEEGGAGGDDFGRDDF